MALGQFQFIHDSPDIALCYHSLPDSRFFLLRSERIFLPIRPWIVFAPAGASDFALEGRYIFIMFS